MSTTAKRVPPCPPGFTDHIYKVAHGVHIPLRIWPAPKNKKNAPWLLWIHGGDSSSSRIVGFANSLQVALSQNAWVYQACQQYGYHIVSIAYRLTPQASFDEIVQDCKDSLFWCMANLPTIVGPDAVDVARYVVAGDSSGATLSTLCGHVLRPRPKAVIDVFGMVDVLDQPELPDLTSRTAMCDPWWLEYDNPEVAMDKAKRDRNPANAEIACPWSWELPGEMSLEDLRSFWCLPDFTVQDKHYRRLDLSNYLGWKAEGFDGIYRKDTFKDDVEYTAYLKSVSPYYLLDEYPDYPPTFIIHGTADLAVRVEQSYKFAEKLRDLDVPVGERYKWGGEHCFENQIEGPESEGWDEFVVPCMEFVDKYIRE